jgi:hypothetical protein
MDGKLYSSADVEAALRVLQHRKALVDDIRTRDARREAAMSRYDILRQMGSADRHAALDEACDISISMGKIAERIVLLDRYTH